MEQLQIIRDILGLFDGSNTLIEWLNVIIPLFGYAIATGGAFAYRGLIKEIKAAIETYRDGKLEASDKGRNTSKNEMKRVAREGFDVLEKFADRHKSFSKLLGRWWRSIKRLLS